MPTDPIPSTTLRAYKAMLGRAVGSAMIKTTGQQRQRALGPATVVKPERRGFRFNTEKLMQGLDTARKNSAELTPYISNIANSFRRAPMPIKPIRNASATLPLINLGNERNAVNRTTYAANRATERNVDANTAEAVKQFTEGNRFNQLSTINERETNANQGIRGQQAMLDYQNQVGNNAKMDEYNESLVERDIANAREQSQNLANAGDKYTLIGNERQKARVEADKVRVLSSLYRKSGVLTRDNSIRAEWKKMGLKDPTNMNYSDLEGEEKTKKAYGGSIKRAYGGRMRKIC